MGAYLNRPSHRFAGLVGELCDSPGSAFLPAVRGFSPPESILFAAVSILIRESNR